MKNKGKTLFLVCAVLLVAASGLQATPVTCASLSDQTFAGLQAAGSCTIGDKTFDNFSFTSADVTSSQLAFSVVNAGSAAIGFNFQTGELTQVGVGAKDLSIGFDVTAPGPIITSGHLAQSGAAINGGVASIGETLCLGGDIAGCPKGSTRSLTTNAGFGGTALTDSVTFGGVTEVGVVKDLSVMGTTATSVASISLFQETFDQKSSRTGVPEPGFYGLLAGGLAGIFMLAKRRKKTA